MPGTTVLEWSAADVSGRFARRGTPSAAVRFGGLTIDDGCMRNSTPDAALVLVVGLLDLALARAVNLFCRRERLDAPNTIRAASVKRIHPPNPFSSDDGNWAAGWEGAGTGRSGNVGCKYKTASFGFVGSDAPSEGSVTARFGF